LESLVLGSNQAEGLPLMDGPEVLNGELDKHRANILLFPHLV